MKKFKGEMFCPKCAEEHLSKLKTKLTDKKLSDILAGEKLEIAKKALIEAQQAVQASRALKNKSKIDAKKAEDDVLVFSEAMKITPFSGRIRIYIFWYKILVENEKQLMKMQKEIGYRGAGNLSRSDMIYVRVMTGDEVVNVLKMLDLGATHVHFQGSVFKLYFSIPCLQLIETPKISNDGVSESFGDWTIDVDNDDLMFSITDARLIDDEDEFVEGNIFRPSGFYTYDMYFINEQNEIVDYDEVDQDYKICINISPREQSKNCFE